MKKCVFLQKNYLFIHKLIIKLKYKTMYNSKSLLRLLTVNLFFFSAVLFSCNSSTETETTDMDADTVLTTQSSEDVNMQASTKAEAILGGTYTDTTLSGNATFEEMDGKVKMILNITAPAKANQSVAVHIHEHGACGDMGKEAHGHWNPTNKQHGKWGSDSFHSGDIGNVQLDNDGKGSLEMETDLWSIGGDSTTNILDRAIIVHGGVDDFKTQPTGNAGNRIGCGVINKL